MGLVKTVFSPLTNTTPLVTITDLQKLKLGEAIIKRLRMSPYKTKYVPDFNLEELLLNLTYNLNKILFFINLFSFNTSVT